MNKKYMLALIVGLLVIGTTACGLEPPLVPPSANPDFWDVHGVFFLIFMNLFPRITMLVATPFPFTFLGWMGWLFVPRIYAAILATSYYWDTNPVLCVVTWIVALGTTGGTTGGAANKARSR